MRLITRTITFTPWAMAVLVSMDADASTSSTSIGVSATVTASCVVGAAPLAFGNYAGGILDQTANLSVQCTSGTPYTVGLDNGTGTAASAATRQMTGPNNQTLGYGVYSDAARTVTWGSTTGTNTISGTGTGTPQSIPAYGRIPASQAPSPGAYTDTITVTLTY
jgi:spore coat protein U-like protein